MTGENKTRRKKYRKPAASGAGTRVLAGQALDLFVSYRRAARFLGVSKRTVQRLVADGALARIDGPRGRNGRPTPLLLLADLFVYRAAATDCLTGGCL